MNISENFDIYSSKWQAPKRLVPLNWSCFFIPQAWQFPSLQSSKNQL